MKGELDILQEKVSAIARECIASRPELLDLISMPDDLVEAMAARGLFRIGIPGAFGGSGGAWCHISAAGMAMAEGGNNLGCACSWLMNAIIARFLFLGIGTYRQKTRYLPDLAAGKKTACLAISEPGVGGHPKHLKTSAEKSGDSWIINGEKTYLTNGPVADLYVVLAVTSEDEGKKDYTAFVVPSDAPGLKKSEPADLGFLRPCPHGSITLEQCTVDAGSILGRMGHAYTDIALPFRQLEDVMMSGPLVGGARAQTRIIADFLKRKGTDPGREVLSGLGEVASTLDTLEVLALDAALMLDAGGAGEQGLLPLTLFMRRTAQGLQAVLSDIIASAGIETDEPYASLTKDLTSSLRIAGNVAQMRQEKLGRTLLS